MRVHVGNGSIYLREWVNVDLPSDHVFLAKERPDLVEQFATLESDYYGRHRDKTPEKWRKGAICQDTVCDVYGSFGFLPVRGGSVEEILSRQAFEHLDRGEAKQALRECHRALKPGGFLRIDIPDPDETLRQYRKTGDEFFARHLFGPRRDVYGSHFHYTRDMLKRTVEQFGFKFCGEEENIHENYPAFCLRFRRV